MRALLIYSILPILCGITLAVAGAMHRPAAPSRPPVVEVEPRIDLSFLNDTQTQRTSAAETECHWPTWRELDRFCRNREALLSFQEGPDQIAPFRFRHMPVAAALRIESRAAIPEPNALALLALGSLVLLRSRRR